MSFMARATFAVPEKSIFLSVQDCFTKAPRQADDFEEYNEEQCDA